MQVSVSQSMAHLYALYTLLHMSLITLSGVYQIANMRTNNMYDNMRLQKFGPMLASAFLSWLMTLGTKLLKTHVIIHIGWFSL